MKTANSSRLKLATQLVENFTKRTGIDNENGSSAIRYLWTDALAVQCLLALYLNTRNKDYLDKAQKLVDLVHYHLGRFHPEDKRSGWISGLSDKRDRQHPTAAGLRIGKELPERRPDEAYDEIKEWKRDGQYFHYNTRWIDTLLSTYRVSKDLKYARWAAELLEASSRFLVNQDSEMRLYWKMSTDLSRPLVNSQGFQDPLDGLICSLQVLDIFPDKRSELNYLLSEFKALCFDRSWKSRDALSAAGLLLNALKAASVKKPEPLIKPQPGELFEQAFENLDDFNRNFSNGAAEARLAFRECGLSMAINLLKANSEIPEVSDLSKSHLQSYVQLAHEIEDFWILEKNRRSGNWMDHENINSVSLAASLLAAESPEAFLEIKSNKKTEVG